MQQHANMEKPAPEEVFAKLVGRHLNLVYDCCTRALPNHPELAEQACQVAFRQLAKRLKWLPPRRVAMWLHRAAVRVTSRLRDEHKISPPVQEPGSERSAVRQRETPPAWIIAQPHLDRAIDCLSRKDRHLIISYYLSSGSQRRLASFSRTSQHDNTDRLSLSIDRLREILCRRGVTITAVALADCLMASQSQKGLPDLATRCVACLDKRSAPAAVRELAARTKRGIAMRWVKRAAVLLGALALFWGSWYGITQLGIGPRRPYVWTGIPIEFELERDSHVTLAINDSNNKRVATLLSNVPLPKGKHTLSWNGCKDGLRHEDGMLVHPKVDADIYKAVLLHHTGLGMSYQFAVNSPGSPPWITKNTSTGWLSDHCPPSDVLYVPKGSGSPYGDGNDQVLAASVFAESGHALAWLDLRGKKLHGTKIAGWCGGRAMARDHGKKAIPGNYAYTLHIWHGSRNQEKVVSTGKLVVVSLNAKGMQQCWTYTPTRAMVPFNATRMPASLAIRDGIMVVSDPVDKLLHVLNLRAPAAQREIKQIPIADPRGVLFDHKGGLCILDGRRLKRYKLQIDKTAVRLDKEQILVGSGLEDPQQLAIDSRGNIFVSDWGKSHQVKSFTPSGKLHRTYGDAGGPQIGPYNHRRMHHPHGMTVDNCDVLWVAECDYLPRRISRWDCENGDFINAWYGGAQYGGGGVIDSKDRTRFYVAHLDRFRSPTCLTGGMEFAVDWNTGDAKLKNIYYRSAEPASMPDGEIVDKEWMAMQPQTVPSTTAPMTPAYVKGRQYMIDSVMNEPQRQPSWTGIWLYEGGVLRPVASVGFVRAPGSRWYELKRPEINALIPAQVDPNQLFYSWADLNEDGLVQPKEIKFAKVRWHAARKKSDRVTINPRDLSVLTSSFFRIFPRIMANGVPVYSLKSIQYLLEKDNTSCEDMLDLGGGMVVSGHRGYYYGNLQWSLPIRHGPWGRSSIHPDDVADPRKFLGPPCVSPNKDLERFFARTTRSGRIAFYTADGLLFGLLGKDGTSGSTWPEKLRKGDDLSNEAFGDKHFRPTMCTTPEGTYMVIGMQNTCVVKLQGLDSVRRKSWDIKLSDRDLRYLPAYVESHRRGRRRSCVAMISERPPSLDGHLGDWPDLKTCWARIDEEARAALAISQSRLFVAFQTEERALDNAGRNTNTLFMEGSGLDVMLQCRKKTKAGFEEKHLRLYVTKVAGRPRAVLYERQEGEPSDGTITHESFSGKVHYALVKDISSLIQFMERDGNFEFSLPLDALGFGPPPWSQVLGDFGILRGNGRELKQRVYWNNRRDLISTDITQVARINPWDWGNIYFSKSSRIPLSGEELSGAKHGLRFRAYEPSKDFINPEVHSKLKATKEGVIPSLTLPQEQGESASILDGYFLASETGWYAFRVINMSRRLRFQLASSAFTVPTHRDRHCILRLKKGYHKLNIAVVRRGNQGLKVFVTGPELEKRPLPAKFLYHAK